MYESHHCCTLSQAALYNTLCSDRYQNYVFLGLPLLWAQHMNGLVAEVVALLAVHVPQCAASGASYVTSSNLTFLGSTVF